MASRNDLRRNDPGRWIKYHDPAGDAAFRLVCFPHAGGSAPFFRPLRQQLQPRTEVLAVQYPGRFDRHEERLIDDAAELADAVHACLGTLDDRPTALFGHSMGALVAFEVARRMEASGPVPPLALFVSSRRAPASRRPDSYDVSDDQLIALMIRLGGTSPELLEDREALRSVLRVMRNDYRVVQNYRYASEPKLSCPILALLGTDDTQVTTEEAFMWKSDTSSTLTLKSFPGGHFYLTSKVAEVAAVVTATLLNSRTASPT